MVNLASFLLQSGPGLEKTDVDRRISKLITIVHGDRVSFYCAALSGMSALLKIFFDVSPNNATIVKIVG